MGALNRFTGIDESSNRVASIQMALRTVPMLLRGLLVSPFLGRSSGRLFVGRGARIKNPQKFSHTGRVIIEDFAEIHCLSQGGIVFGDEISIGRGVQIRPTGYYGGPVGQGLVMGDRSSIGPGGYIGCSGQITIGNDVLMGPGVRIFGENHNFDSGKSTIKSQGVTLAPVTIGDDCWIGSGVTITAGVTIGTGVVVAAGSVVTKDVPDNVVVAGVPARVLRTRVASEKIL
ncbi:acyltransferase [Herbiconiux ginsengi]|uniref:Acetyltransferase (Isoleucine patch superfamily) n=1 Tax=Herbiconiux ginsengi TaxID=381665 RepID=A0A1H3SNR5_9MICO|nr:acyltransferase [Herbiconiux ginsengi]SDZ39318.1 Acetyltransferase (isoleucine patch superfamily) [Herbiconiux ginsengi]